MSTQIKNKIPGDDLGVIDAMNEALAEIQAEKDAKKAKAMNRIAKSGIGFVKDDGGRKAAGFVKDGVGDCVARAIAIATEKDYAEVHADLEKLSGRSADKGVATECIDEYLGANGWVKTKIRGLTIGLKNEFRGRAIVHQKRHVAAIVNGDIRDTWDSRLNWKREGLSGIKAVWTKA